MAVNTPNDGRLTDNKGRVVNSKNTLIFMTSNIGSHYLSRHSGIIRENFENLEKKDVDAVVEKTQREVMERLRKTVRPEFLNRVVRYLSDELIMFREPAPYPKAAEICWSKRMCGRS